MSDATNKDTAQPARGKSVKGEHALETLTFRSRTTGADAAARSRLVRRLRVALPAFAGLLIVVFFLNTGSNDEAPLFLDEVADLNPSTEDLRMANPRFSGVDDEGQPYEITAAIASQDPENKDLIQLDAPRAVQGGADADEASIVTAQSGLYQSDENILFLNDDVTFSHELGPDTYVLRTPSATVSLDKEILTSDAGVSAVGSDGSTLKADRMRAFRSEGRVRFEGNVSMRFYPNKVEPASPPLRESEDKKDEQ